MDILMLTIHAASLGQRNICIKYTPWCNGLFPYIFAVACRSMLYKWVNLMLFWVKENFELHLTYGNVFFKCFVWMLVLTLILFKFIGSIYVVLVKCYLWTLKWVSLWIFWFFKGGGVKKNLSSLTLVKLKSVQTAHYTMMITEVLTFASFGMICST